MTDEDIQRVRHDVAVLRGRRRLALGLALVLAYLSLVTLGWAWWSPLFVLLPVMAWSEYIWRPGGFGFEMKVDRWVSDPTRWQRERHRWL